MRDQRGKIKLITLIGIVFAFTIVLFALVVYSKISVNNENVVNNQNISQLNEVEEQSNNVTEENTIKDEPVVQDINIDDFDTEFLKMENKNVNIIYSPLSIKYGLKMLQEGAEGNTYNQIENVIGNLNVPTYKNVDKKLSLANGVYIRDIYSKNIEHAFINNLTNKYKADVRYDSFKDATNVNKWIEDKTLGIIKNMIKDELVQDDECKMLLINAVAIDMSWKTNFNFDDTSGEAFYLEDGKNIVATTMTQETSSNSVSYYIGDNVTALTMDLEKCEDTELEFMAIMPDKDITTYIKSLTTNKIEDINTKLISASNVKQGVKIQIPKFKFGYDLNLEQDLKNIGITDIFNGEKADFSKMTKDKSLYVGEALHKADIDFSEEGVKAAAVTVFGMVEDSIVLEDDKPKEVKIDKPFVFFIRDKKNKEIWFTGTVYEPNLWEDDKADYQARY